VSRVVPDSAAGQDVSVYEQNPAAAKRTSRRLDEHGRRLERFSNQPTRYARRLSGGYPRVGARPSARDPTAALGGPYLSLPGGPQLLLLHHRPIPSCRHEFCDHGRDRRSHRRRSAVSACISNPRRDTSPRHGKKAARSITALPPRPAHLLAVWSQRLRVHGWAPRTRLLLGLLLPGSSSERSL